MKKLLTTRILLPALLAVLIFSCSDDDNGPKELFPKLDGFYVYGTNTVAASATEPAAKMNLAFLDLTKAPNIPNKDGVYGKVMYIGANSTIKFAKVEDEVATSFGAEDGGTVEDAADVENVSLEGEIIHGTLEEDSPEIEITDEGLYYIFVDSNTGKFIIAPVDINMIGGATPEGWNSGTFLDLKSTSKDSTVFEGVVMMKGADGYKYRLNKGWGVYEEPGVITTQTSLGVDDYGLAWDTGTNDPLIYTDKTMPNKEGGSTLVKLKYTAATDTWKETKVLTYSDHTMGIIGTAYAGGNFNGDGTALGLHKPVKNGNVYTWTWNNAQLLVDGEFIFLQNGIWGGLLIDFTGATVGGSAVTSGKIKDATAVGGAFHNFFVATAGTYDITLVINAVTGAKNITISE